MQKSLKKLAALALLASTDAITVESSTSFARTWLKTHAAPSGDELAELKGVNPEAYAIVKALLTKRSLGLLDPKHPTASFANAQAPPAEADASAAPAQGADAFQLSDKDREQLSKKNGGSEADDASSSVAVPYSTIGAAPAHHNWLNWKPQDSAMDDDAMVKSVLGEVASLKGGQAQAVQEPDVAAVNPRGSALAADEAAFGGKLGVDVAAAAEEEKEEKAAKAAAPPAPVAAAPASENAAPSTDGNSYLNAVDFGVKTEEKPKRAAALQGNSYLRGLDLSGTGKTDDSSAAAQSTASKDSDVNYLASFSWGDDKPAEAKKPAPAPVAAPKKKATGLNVLSSWLGGGSTAKAAPVAPVAAAQAPATAGNPYLTNW